MHCHILPGVDDGAESINEAIELLKMEYEDGVRKICLTPHFRMRMFETSREDVQKQFEKLQKETSERFPDLRLELGCEFHSCMDILEFLDRDNRYTMGNSRWVLLEFSGVHDERWIRERCSDLLYHGYTPIIAHAERYPALYRKYDTIEQLIDMGAFIQINADSILGKDGFGRKLFCKKLMKMDFIHFIGSDAHDPHHRKPMMGKCAKYLTKIMGEEYARRILAENPQKLMEMGEDYGSESAKR